MTPSLRLFLYCLGMSISCSFSSCQYFQSTPSKEDYLANYKSFMQDVQGNYNIYDSKDWNNADEKINDFSQTQYHIHENQLSYHDKLEVGKYPILYHLYKYKRLTQNQVNEVYRPDAEDLRRNIITIMDTTSSIFTGFDRDIRDMLLDFKRERLNQAGSTVVIPDTIRNKK